MSRDILIGTYRIMRKMGAEQEEIVPETNLSTDLFFDETDRNCLLFFLESRFNIDVSDQEAEKLHTIDDMLHLVERHRALMN